MRGAFCSTSTAPTIGPDHGGQQLLLWNAHYDSRGFSTDPYLRGDPKAVSGVLRPGKTDGPRWRCAAASDLGFINLDQTSERITIRLHHAVTSLAAVQPPDL